MKLICAAAMLFTLAGCSSGSSDTLSDQNANGMESTAAIGDNENIQVAEVVTTTDSESNANDDGAQGASEQSDEASTALPTDDDAGTASEMELEPAEEQEPTFQTEEEALEQDIQLAGNSENELTFNEAETHATAITPLQLKLRILTGRTLQALNQTLMQGELLTEQQEQCIGSFDPAFGEPLLAVNCNKPLATGEIPIYARSASFNNTAECRASLADVSIAATDVNCTLEQATFIVNTKWLEVVPEGQVGRPQPTIGATVSFNANENILSIENLEQRLSGTFFCAYRVDSGNLISDTQIGSCSNEATRIASLIDLHFEDAEQ